MKEIRQITDEEIIRKCLNGEREVYRVFVERYQDKIFNLIYRYVGSYDSAQDIAQEAFVKAFESLGSFRNDARFSTWLYRIAVNKCKDFLKDRRRDDVSLERVAAPASSRYSSPFVGPEEGFLRRERATNINKAILALSPMYREAFLLRHMEGLSYNEMRKILGLPINTLKMRVFRARKSLRRMLTSSSRHMESR